MEAPHVRLGSNVPRISCFREVVVAGERKKRAVRRKPSSAAICAPRQVIRASSGIDQRARQLQLRVEEEYKEKTELALGSSVDFPRLSSAASVYREAHAAAATQSIRGARDRASFYAIRASKLAGL